MIIMKPWFSAPSKFAAGTFANLIDLQKDESMTRIIVWKIKTALQKFFRMKRMVRKKIISTLTLLKAMVQVEEQCHPWVGRRVT